MWQDRGMTTGPKLKEMTEDARFLLRENRPWGAFALAMACVAASSVRRYPWGKTPNKSGAAFRKFLDDHDFGSLSLGLSPGTEPLTFTQVIYKYYRCALLHEAELEQRFELVSTPERYFAFDCGSVQIGLPLVEELLWNVTFSPANAEIFGNRFFRLRPIDPALDEAAMSLALDAKYAPSNPPPHAIANGGYRFMKQCLRVLVADGFTPQTMRDASQEDVLAKFNATVRLTNAPHYHPAGHGMFGLFNEDRGLSPTGLAYLRQVAGIYDWIEITGEELRKLPPLDPDKPHGMHRSYGVIIG